MKTRKRRFVAEVESIEGRLLLSTAPQFTVKDLGITLGVGSINRLGQVTGTIQQVRMAPAIVALSGQDGSPLKPLVPVLDPYGTEFGLDYSNGIAVNDSQQVLLFGVSYVNGVEVQSLYVYSNGSLTKINDAQAYLYEPGNQLNNSGNVVGMLQSNSHAFFYDGAVHDLETLGGSYSNAFGINDSNQIVGSSETVGGKSSRAFFYDGTMRDLGTLGGQFSWAYAINASGQVVGSATNSNGEVHAFISDPNGGSLHDIGLPSGAKSDEAYGVNDLGHVIGYATMTDNLGYPFFYNGGPIVNINSLIPSSSGFNIIDVRGINNSDQIAAWGIDSIGLSHALLLTPIPPVTPMITWSNPADIVYGTPISATQLNATADVPGTFTYSVPQGTVLHAGAAQVIQATFTPDDLTRYTTATAEVSINVLKAPLTVTANNAQVRYPFQIPPLTGTITGLVNGDTDVAIYTTTAVQGSWAGYYPIVPHLTDSNYNITFVNGTLTIYWSVPPGGF